ncbi:hypothetical protein D5086_024893 [Populus alba]|uniref:Uncharacterized protein n=1 Tax=Populus alba TaxID=43335 RepID=A0ACC4B6T2_POPAL
MTRERSPIYPISRDKLKGTVDAHHAAHHSRRSLLTAQLRTSRGGPVMSSLLGLDGCGVTLDDDAKEEFALGGGRDNFLVMQVAMAEHLPSLSELETE